MRVVSSDVPEFLRKLIKNPTLYLDPNHDKLFTIEELEHLTELVVKNHKDKPNFVKLSGNFKDVCIVGDLHGDFASTWRVVKPFLKEQIESLVFLGDYVDRGDHSLLVFGLVLSLMITWPDRVIALRGNHEDLEMNYHYGLTEELQQCYHSHDETNQVHRLLDTIYDYLPLAALSHQGSICLHGGIPRDLTTIKELKHIPKPHSKLMQIQNKQLMKKIYRTFYQIRWNDPREHQKQRFRASGRGPSSLTFNEEVLVDFVENSGATRVIRSHEAIRGGFQTLFNDQLLHIFSSEPYYGRVPKAYVIHEQQDNRTVLRDLDFNIAQTIM